MLRKKQTSVIDPLRSEGSSPRIPQSCSHLLPSKCTAPPLPTMSPCVLGFSPGGCPSHPPVLPCNWSASDSMLEAERQPVGPERRFSRGVLSRTGERICFPPEGRIDPQVPGWFETRLLMPLLHFTLKFHHQLLGPLASGLHGLTVPYPMFAAVSCPVEGVIVKCHLAESELHCTAHESICRDT